MPADPDHTPSAAKVDCPTCHGASTVDPDPACPTCHGEGEVESAATVPNPGSPEAVEKGCICAVMDNGRGRGYLGMCNPETGKPMFVITVGAQGCDTSTALASRSAEGGDRV